VCAWNDATARENLDQKVDPTTNAKKNPRRRRDQKKIGHAASIDEGRTPRPIATGPRAQKQNTT
jgi:hypothetical protein